MTEVPGPRQSPENHTESFEDVLRAPFLPENYLDEDLLDELVVEMRRLLDGLSTTESVVSLVTGYVAEALRHKQANIATKLMSEREHEGLRRHNLLIVSLRNTAVERARRSMSLADHRGDQQARRAYADTVVVLLNTIRFQLLHGEYDPTDEFWQHLSESIGTYHGAVLQLHLGPGIRERTVRVDDSPSDHLPPSPRVP